MSRPGAALTLLHDAQAVAGRVREMAAEINAVYAGAPVLLLGVLKGAFIFCADLIRELKMPLEVQFIRLSSYGQAAQSSGTVHFETDKDISLSGRHVLIVEDIVDTGLSLASLHQRFAAGGAASIRAAAFVNKRERRQAEVRVDFVGFDVPSGFIVGYGMDYAERYRELPGIYVLDLPE